MAYASQTPSAHRHLEDKVLLAVLKLASGALGGAEDPLAQALLQQPEQAARVATLFVQANSGVSVESSDAQIDTALMSPATIAGLKASFRISA